MIIAVDGPAASGKGTLAFGLARHFGLPHLDTGLLYRAVGLAVGPDDGGPDVFAHYSAIASSGYRSLEENQKVQFDVTQGPKGPQAANITSI